MNTRSLHQFHSHCENSVVGPTVQEQRVVAEATKRAPEERKSRRCVAFQDEPLKRVGPPAGVGQSAVLVFGAVVPSSCWFWSSDHVVWFRPAGLFSSLDDPGHRPKGRVFRLVHPLRPKYL